MSSYVDRHAELYDLFYANKPYSREADFVHKCLQQNSVGSVRRMLELACGTGSHAFVFEALGYDVIATDYSEDMLQKARAKAVASSSRIEFRHQDMRSLDLKDGPFDAVVCLFDSIGYVATNDAIKQVLQGVHRQLRPDGLFVFEFWHAGAMLRSYDPLRVSRWSSTDTEVLRIAETSLDCAKQLGTVSYTIYELRRNGTYSSFKETQVNRYFLVQEMAGWLTGNGFTPLGWFAGFSESAAIDEQTWHIVAMARRNA